MPEKWIDVKNTEIYIKGLIYYENYWVDDPDELINKIVDSLKNIEKFEYMSIALNLSQVFATAQAPMQYSGMILFFKNVIYNEKEYLSLDECNVLKSQIQASLNAIQELKFGDIEIRTNSLMRKIYEQN